MVGACGGQRSWGRGRALLSSFVAGEASSRAVRNFLQRETLTRHVCGKFRAGRANCPRRTGGALAPTRSRSSASYASLAAGRDVVGARRFTSLAAMCPSKPVVAVRAARAASRPQARREQNDFVRERGNRDFKSSCYRNQGSHRYQRRTNCCLGSPSGHTAKDIRAAARGRTGTAGVQHELSRAAGASPESDGSEPRGRAECAARTIAGATVDFQRTPDNCREQCPVPIDAGPCAVTRESSRKRRSLR